MRKRVLLGCLLSGLLVAPVLAAPLGYHEGWDTYTDNSDPDYGAVWATIDYRFNIVQTNPFIAPNCLELPSSSFPASRGMMNDLADGIVDTAPGGVEMNPGEYVVPTADSELALGMYLRIQAATQRNKTNAITVISMGDQIANIPTDTSVVLPTPIPALAWGMVNGYAGAGNVSPYFFNGKQWVRTALGVTTGYNRLWMRIRSDGSILVENSYGTPSSAEYTLEYGAQYLGGFDTISVLSNNILGATGTNRLDDVYLQGGNIVPEPATMALLLLGVPFLRRRRA